MDALKSSASEEFINWLKSQRHELNFDDIGIYACHGSPKEPLRDYLYPDSDLSIVNEMPFNIFLFGHTHYPMLRNFNKKIIINPGSIGQPRHGGNPSFAVLKLSKFQIDFKEFAYDKDKIIKQINMMGEKNQYLRKVLMRSNEQT